jgi:hypothetical protein
LIDASIVLNSCEPVTGFYGEPHRDRHKESWYVLRFLRVQSDSPWQCLGNFNEVLLAEEQIGGNDRDREAWQMAAFEDAVKTLPRMSRPAWIELLETTGSWMLWEDQKS